MTKVPTRWPVLSFLHCLLSFLVTFVDTCSLNVKEIIVLKSRLSSKLYTFTKEASMWSIAKHMLRTIFPGRYSDIFDKMQNIVPLAVVSILYPL